MEMMPNKQKGFTLIELLIVVAIIGVLASVAIPSYRQHLIDSQANYAETIILAITAAENAERQTEGSFTTGTPPTDSDGDGWAEGSDGDGLFTIGSTDIDLGNTTAFEFKVEMPTGTTFRVTARGKDEGLDNGDQLILNFNPASYPRASWSATGNISAP